MGDSQQPDANLSDAEFIAVLREHAKGGPGKFGASRIRRAVKIIAALEQERDSLSTEWLNFQELQMMADSLRSERDRLRGLLTTAYDLVQESLEKPQYDYHARARSLVKRSRAALKGE